MTREDKTHVLVVDDDDRLRALLKKFLREQDFIVTAVHDVQQARRAMAWFTFDVIVLDVMMPGETGLEFLATLPTDKRPRVLMLSAMGEAHDRIKGLEFGADDYLPKPFEPKELVLRIKTILRRTPTPAETTSHVAFGEYVFDTTNNQLTRANALVHLTSSELALLKLLVTRAGTPITREELAKHIPGAANERSIDVQITRLRKKIEAGDKPVHLQTVRGAGYVLYAKPVRGSS